MYSLNVPVPSAVSALAADLARELPGARPRRRGEHTLVVKRLGQGDRPADARLAARTRELLAGTPPFAVRIAGVEFFADPAAGEGPVVYLAVESPGLVALHETLAAEFDPVDDIEGEAYVPHVTVARGGTREAARRLADRSIEPVEFVADTLQFWDAERDQPAGTVTLPA